MVTAHEVFGTVCVGTEVLIIFVPESITKNEENAWKEKIILFYLKEEFMKSWLLFENVVIFLFCMRFNLFLILRSINIDFVFPCQLPLMYLPTSMRRPLGTTMIH